jgi:general secretion pathway protein G
MTFQFKLVSIRGNKAFTLIEFGVVLVIIGLFFMTFTPAMLKMVETSKTTNATQVIKEMQTDIEDFYKTNGRYPDSLEEVFGEVPLDEWGNPYQYLNMAKAKGNGKKRKDKNLVPINSDYDLYSMGPDGKTSSPLTASVSQDDIVRGRNGIFVGLATEY